MKKRIHPRHTTAEATPAGTYQLFYILLTILCVAFLAAGFFLAARQHFNAINLGIKNASLRSQFDELSGEQRRLILSREVARSPVEIKRTARSRGFRDFDRDSVPVQASIVVENAKPLVLKTALTNSVASPDIRKSVKAFFPLPEARERNDGRAAISSKVERESISSKNGSTQKGGR